MIRPNLLIDVTAARDVTAWQQLRGRAIRAWPSWTNDCYRLLSVLVGHHLPDGVETEPEAEEDLDQALLGLLAEIATPRQRAVVAAEGIHGLTGEERHALAVDLLARRNKVTHIYELVKATGSTSQVIYDRSGRRWRRRDAIAAKHRQEIGVDLFSGVKTTGVAHAPLIYGDDPRRDVPDELQ